LAIVSAQDGGPSWADIATWYDDLITGGSGPHQTADACLLRLVPSLKGKDVLDVACGQGLASRALADAGARRVVGVDNSEQMIELARGHVTRPSDAPLSFVRDNAETLTTIGDATFDGATCQLGLMDIPDLASTLRAVRRVLKPRVWFTFVIGHPCFLVPDSTPVTVTNQRPRIAITGYFDERFWRSTNPHGVRRVGNYHRTLSTYLNALTHCGFSLDAVEEPEASPLLAQQQPLYKEVPIFFAARTIEQ
jgi:ubiquinone/menaquinone biosynthesis C-methylase UbiE